MMSKAIFYGNFQPDANIRFVKEMHKRMFLEKSLGCNTLFHPSLVSLAMLTFILLCTQTILINLS